MHPHGRKYSGQFKGIVSIILLKKWLEKNCKKNIHNHLRSNYYDVCTAAALCILNILDVVILENIYIIFRY
jgi:hypothetical protein